MQFLMIGVSVALTALRPGTNSDASQYKCILHIYATVQAARQPISMPALII